MATGDPGLDLQQLQQVVSQVQANLAQLQVSLQGDPAQGGLSYTQVVDFVKDVAPKIPQLAQGLDVLTQRVANVENTIEPIIKSAQEEINNLRGAEEMENCRSEGAQEVEI